MKQKILYSYILTILLYWCICPEAVAQQNELGVYNGMTLYGNPALSSLYEGKTTYQTGFSIDIGLFYTRFFKNEENAIMIDISTISRDKDVEDSISYEIIQSFFRIKTLYYKQWNINERIDICVGVGAYYDLLMHENRRYENNPKKSVPSRNGGINTLGVLLHIPLRVCVVENQFIKIGLDLASDVITTMKNSRLYSIGLYTAYVFGF